MTRHASNMTFSGLISPEPMLVMLVADVHSRFTDFYIYNVTCILMFNAMQLCYICKHHLNNTRIRISSGKYIFIFTQINIYIYVTSLDQSFCILPSTNRRKKHQQNALEGRGYLSERCQGRKKNMAKHRQFTWT